MLPFIYQSSDFTIPTFFFMIMVATLASTFYLYLRAPKLGFSQVVVLDISLWGTVAGIIGARFFHIFLEYPGYYWEDPVRVFYFWQGGFVGYGVFFGITLSTLLYLKIRKLSFLDYGDFIALAMPILIFGVRLGCLGAGCCYGKPTDFFLHLVFNNPASDAGHDYLGMALHATQLYDLTNAVIIFLLCHWVYSRRQYRGQVIMVFFIAHGILRSLNEFLRGDADRGVYLGGWISTSQFISLFAILLCVGLGFHLKKNYPIKHDTRQAP